MEASPVKVLLVAESPSSFSLSQRRLEGSGCQCTFAGSEREVGYLLSRESFDIVLSIKSLGGGNTRVLGSLLAGTRASLFCAFPIEDGCLWLTVLKNGQACVGAPAMRPNEFAGALDELVTEIRASGNVLPAAVAA